MWSGRRSASGIAEPFWAGLFSGPAEPIATRAPAPARTGRVRARKSRRLMVTRHLENARLARIIPCDLACGRAEILERHPDAVGMRPEAQDAHAEREDVAEERARQEHSLPGVHARHQLAVQAIRALEGGPRRREAEREERELRLGDDRHVRDRAYRVG